MMPTPTSARRSAQEVRIAARYATGLPRFLRARLSVADASERVGRQLAAREASFLDVVRRGMLAVPGSPYRALLGWAGIEYGDIATAVKTDGVESTLERLYSAGVYLTLAEFKGLVPIQRPGLELLTRPEDFDNPLVTPVLKRLTGGSRGSRRSVLANFEHLTHEAAYLALFVEAFELSMRPAAAWRPVPPSTAGLNAALYSAKIGRPLARWFSQNELERAGGSWKDYLVTKYALTVSRALGVSLPTPEHVPLTEAVRVAEWLAERRAAGRPAWLNAPASSGVRVCLAARESGLDIEGTLFRLGGEPLTPARAAAVAGTGSTAVCFYTMSEIGRIGIACAAPSEPDDVHVVSDSVAVTQPRGSDGRGGPAGALFHTSVRPSTGKVALNVESGDEGILSARDCGCPLGDAGFEQHLHTVRSYEKLTTEGATFLGGELMTVLEELLPTRFGGRPTDYQLVEEEGADGLATVDLVVSPSIGPLDEAALLQAVHDALSTGPSYRSMMAGLWREGRTMRVVRREPHATQAGKLLPLHVVRRDGS